VERIRRTRQSEAVRIPIAPEVFSLRMDTLGPGVELRPGRLEIEFSGLEELLTKLFEVNPSTPKLDGRRNSRCREAPGRAGSSSPAFQRGPAILGLCRRPGMLPGEGPESLDAVPPGPWPAVAHSQLCLDRPAGGKEAKLSYKGNLLTENRGSPLSRKVARGSARVSGASNTRMLNYFPARVRGVPIPVTKSQPFAAE
jgi:hypothetical protein